MKGTYKIRIQNKRIRYEFEIKRNITILQGESATGKTTLIDMVREFEQNGVNSGIYYSIVYSGEGYFWGGSLESIC